MGTISGQDVDDFCALSTKGSGDTEYQRYIGQILTELQALCCYSAKNILPLLAFGFDITLKTDLMGKIL